MTKAKRSKNRKSCWQRHDKVAYRYSTTYQDWNRATKEGRTAEATRLSVHHSRLFGFGRPTRSETPISADPEGGFNLVSHYGLHFE